MVDAPEGVYPVWKRTVFGELHGSVDPPSYSLDNGIASRGGQEIAFGKPTLEHLDRIPPPPRDQLVGRNVPGVVVLGVALHSPRDRLDQHGASAGPRARRCL